MTSPSRFYLTAAIDYVNGNPHLGHAYEKIGCDVVRRHHRLRGRDVRFTVGSDEHSQSVERAAQQQGMDPEEFSLRQAEVFQRAFAALDVEYTAYVRTSSEANRRSTDRFMQAMYDGGHIYKGPYEAWFCPSCEQFYTDKQLVEGSCPVHGRPVEWVKEENYFFRLSAFQQPLLDHFEANPGFLTPEPRRNEILNVIRGGLDDISVSRGFSHWGFPLPFDPEQVVYVWFDALLSYITGIGFPDGADFERFWPADVHIIGKDITRFHTVMWPAMLLAAGLPLPRRVHAHGFVTLGGRKMSKSTGVRIDPFELVTRFGSDAVRYVLMAEVPFDRDGDVSMETFVDRYNADLANDYGNLVSRTEKMVARYFEGRVPEPGAAEPIELGAGRGRRRGGHRPRGGDGTSRPQRCPRRGAPAGRPGQQVHRRDRALEHVEDRRPAAGHGARRPARGDPGEHPAAPSHPAPGHHRGGRRPRRRPRGRCRRRAAHLAGAHPGGAGGGGGHPLPPARPRAGHGRRRRDSPRMTEDGLRLVDTHCHLVLLDERGMLDEALEQAAAAGVEQIVSIGLNVEDSDRNRELAERLPGVFFTVGWHPHEKAPPDPAQLRSLEEMLRHPRAVAVGEIGLDWYWRPGYHEVEPEVQRRSLRLMLELAAAHAKPIVVHDRDAHEDVVAELRDAFGAGDHAGRGVLHCFSGDAALARAAAGLGMACSFAGTVTYPRTDGIRDAARTVDEGGYVVETDAPFLAPVPYRGRPNQPAYVAATAAAVAGLRGEPAAAVARSATATSRRLFGLPDPGGGDVLGGRQPAG